MTNSKKDVEKALDLLIFALFKYGGAKVTEKNYLSKVRSALRGLSMSWWLKHKYLESIKIQYTGPDKRIKYLYPCEMCLEQIVRGKGEVNHRVPCGKLESKEQIVQYIIKMFVDEKGWQFLCKPCHLSITNEQRKRGWK